MSTHLNGQHLNPHQKFTRGLYQGCTFEFLYLNHYDYACTVLKSPHKSGKYDDEIFMFKEYVFSKQCEKYNLKIQELLDKNPEAKNLLNFGWHCNHNYASVYICDKDYCTWVLQNNINNACCDLKNFRQWLNKMNPIIKPANPVASFIKFSFRSISSNSNNSNSRNTVELNIASNSNNSNARNTVKLNIAPNSNTRNTVKLNTQKKEIPIINNKITHLNKKVSQQETLDKYFAKVKK